MLLSIKIFKDIFHKWCATNNLSSGHPIFFFVVKKRRTFNLYKNSPGVTFHHEFRILLCFICRLPLKCEATSGWKGFNKLLCDYHLAKHLNNLFIL